MTGRIPSLVGQTVGGPSSYLQNTRSSGSWTGPDRTPETPAAPVSLDEAFREALAEHGGKLSPQLIADVASKAGVSYVDAHVRVLERQPDAGATTPRYFAPNLSAAGRRAAWTAEQNRLAYVARHAPGGSRR